MMIGVVVGAVSVLVLAGASPAVSAAPVGRSAAATAAYTAFAPPQPVAIEGYTDSAMEPFITRDGEYLLFNTSNQLPDIAALQCATRVSDQEFSYQGQVQGANTPAALSGPVGQGRASPSAASNGWPP
jgi:hypothetical protein